MGEIVGTIDGAALTRLACGEGSVVRQDVEDMNDVELYDGYGFLGTLPITMRKTEWPDDEELPVLVYRVRAPENGAPAAALAFDGSTPTGWIYLGAIVDEGAGCRAELRVGAGRGESVSLDGGDQRIGVYVGFADEAAVAIVLDAAGIGGLSDERNGEERLLATQLALVDADWERKRMDWPRKLERFLPNLAPGVPRFEDDRLYEKVDVAASACGLLSLPSGAFAMTNGSDDDDGKAFRVAGPRLEVTRFTAWGRLAAWLLRVPGKETDSWREIGFEDICVIGDSSSALKVPDGAWPEADLDFTRNAAGLPLLCITGPDLSVARGRLGLDLEGQVTALIVIS